MKKDIFNTISNQSDDYWVTVSDMMTGLMIIFLFISITYMWQVTREKNAIEKIALRMESIAKDYRNVQEEIYNDLYNEFKDDLIKWNAELYKDTLTIRFNEPDVLFEQGQSELKDQYKGILDDFFPRYVKILYNEKYRNDIEEIRIEGHTSSEWKTDVDIDEAYILNMSLSQDRTRSVLTHVLNITLHDNPNNIKGWVKSKLTANGLSSSKLIYENGVENKSLSRRVDFRIKTNADKRIDQILEKVNNKKK